MLVNGESVAEVNHLVFGTMNHEHGRGNLGNCALNKIILSINVLLYPFCYDELRFVEVTNYPTKDCDEIIVRQLRIVIRLKETRSS